MSTYHIEIEIPTSTAGRIFLFCFCKSGRTVLVTPQIHVRNPFSVRFALSESDQLTEAPVVGSLLSYLLPIEAAQHSTTNDGDVGDDDDGPEVGGDPDASESDGRCRQGVWGWRPT
jgi:hypothetical protein